MEIDFITHSHVVIYIEETSSSGTGYMNRGY
jgi:hypothetical protein